MSRLCGFARSATCIVCSTGYISCGKGGRYAPFSEG
nr:MAG TPA: hypothetical protein [Caudoviricetes sp.]